MRARVVSLVLLLAVGCATRDSVAPEPSLAAPEAPAPVALDPEREARIQEAAALETGAQALVAQGRPGQAITLLPRAVLLDSDDAEAQGLLGSLLLIGRVGYFTNDYGRALSFAEMCEAKAR